ncbi:uncharacterized protein TRAVEDRAFT_24728 [Trametes versicolor FP-101664 SS1]|uniref:Mid2 domain-containing protein n=1 Tax=Trametes versicolor (strain FP-101664) TaxID=717944 RepID=R7S8J6_TRAVS|nr:uncharacterized protein TRAVEDRAFT_24728 [Trametes versicolor FP-101664 SS1]EIW52010.1 hypothetical protein TRAVEDRAFT_24728 [Trametes versicolor FP-101664 SS1]
MLPLSFTRPCLTGLLLVPFVLSDTQETLLVVDDSDSLLIKYRGPWQSSPSSLFTDPEQLNYLGTLTYSNLSGAVANFMFSGTSVSVYGALFPVGTFNRTSLYSIDGQNTTLYAPPRTISSEQHRVLFYNSGTLPFGQHTLTIENVGVEYWFDFIKADGVDPTIGGPNGSYLCFEGFKATATSRDASETQTATRTQSGQVSLSTQGAPSTSVPSAPSSPSNSGASPTPGTSDKSLSLSPGVIAGVGITAAVVEALLILGALWVCRRRKRNTVESNVTPFDPNFAGAMHALPVAGLPQLTNTSQQSDARSPYHLASSSINDRDGSTAWYEPTSSRSYRDTFDTSRAMFSPVGAGAFGRAGTSPLGLASTPAHSTTHLPSHPFSKLPMDGDPVPAPPAMIPGEVFGVLDVRREPRRSRDGGTRIDGGPPGRQMAMSEIENQSIVHTLPPSYDVYPS